AGRIGPLFVAAPLVWKPTTVGGRIPVPYRSSVRLFASYAEYPGIENDWNQRFETCVAAKPPKSVSASQVPMTYQRYRVIRCARRASMQLLRSRSGCPSPPILTEAELFPQL